MRILMGKRGIAGDMKKSANGYLVFTAFVSGTVIMVIELLGSRIIGPPFGVSLFVWTSLITVTLVSLAIGYWAGGKTADRTEGPTALFIIILCAGVYLALVPLIKGAVIEASLSLGLRAGSLTAATVLFGPPLIFLGMVTPYIVKLCMAGQTGSIGNTVGRLYSISTFGSFLGTVLTGFILIPNLGVNNIIGLSSFTLMALTTGYFLIFRRRTVFVIFTPLMAPALLLLSPSPLASYKRPDGTGVTLLMQRDTPYGQIKVVDYASRDSLQRDLLVDNIIQGGIDVNTGLSLYDYPYSMVNLAHAYRPDASKALVIGLGAGIIPTILHDQYGIKADVVEISPEIIETARRYFSLAASKAAVHVEDGRYFLKTTPERYDIIMIDAFAGDVAPGHLLSMEAFKLAKTRLASGGAMVINFIGGNRPSDRLVPESLYATLREAFAFVDVYAAPGFFNSEPTVANLTYLAYDDARDVKKISDDYAVETRARVYPPVKSTVDTIFNRGVALKKGRFVFTDDYNPIDFYDVAAREKWRDLTIKYTDRDILVN